MTMPAVGNLPGKLRIAVLVVFSLLTLAVIASEARSQNPPASGSTAPAVQRSLLVSRVSALGSNLLHIAWRQAGE